MLVVTVRLSVGWVVVVVAACPAACGGGHSALRDASAAEAGEDARPAEAGPQGEADAPVNHRAAGPSCPVLRGASCPQAPICQLAGGCDADSECDAGTNGRCTGTLPAPLSCTYDECFDDLDCPPATPCDCRSSSSDTAANICLTGSHCAIDSDCGPGGYCSPSPSADDCNPLYYCHTSADTCVNAADCPVAAPCDSSDASDCGQTETCNYDVQAGHWACAAECLRAL